MKVFIAWCESVNRSYILSQRHTHHYILLFYVLAPLGYTNILLINFIADMCRMKRICETTI